MSGKNPFRPLALALALSVLAGGPWQASAQMVGPMQPQPQAEMPPGKVVETLTKFFGKKKDGEAETAAENGGEDKPKVVAPDQAGKAGQQPAQPEQEAPPAAYKRPPMLNQPELTNVKIENPQVDPENPPVYNHPRLDDPTNPLGFTDAENRLRNVMTLIENNRIYEAKSTLVPLRQWLVDSTEAHINLYKVLNTVSSAKAQAELEKQLALEFAQLRDQSMLEMGKIYIAEKDYQKAVKELTEVIKSQPRSQLGIRSYELLQEIGFTQKLQLTQ